jgi:hypothetical protein
MLPDVVMGPPLKVRPVEPPETSTEVTVPDPLPEGVAHVLSPRKKVDELAVPVADKSALIVPVLVMVPPETSIKVPLLVATEVTVPSY